MSSLIKYFFSGTVIERGILLTGSKNGTIDCFRAASLQLFFLKNEKRFIFCY